MPTYIQRGETIDFVNNTGSVIKANDAVTLTGRVAVAATEIPVGAKGAVHTVGVFEFPALTTEALTIGQAVYLKDGKVQAASSDAVAAGWVVEAKAQAVTFAKVKIG